MTYFYLKINNFNQIWAEQVKQQKLSFELYKIEHLTMLKDWLQMFLSSISIIMLEKIKI